jgi:hypothetical protein
MTLHLLAKAAKDGGGTTIAGGVNFNDESAAGTGPFDQAVVLVDSTQHEVLGTTADAAQTDQTQTAGLIALVKGIIATLKTLVVLGAGSNIVGKVGVDQTTPGTTDSVTVATGQGAGAAIGATNGAAVITDANGTIQQYLRGLVKLIAAKIGVTVADGDAATVGAKADPAVTDSTASASVVAALKGLLTTIGTKAAGTAALKSLLMGGVFNTTYPTLTNGQQAALQLDAFGGLATVGQRVLGPIKGAINNAQSSYTPSSNVLNIGGLITVSTGLPAGTVLSAVTVRVKALASDVTAFGVPQIKIFDANPATSNFTDNVAQSLNSVDLDKLLANANVSAAATDVGGGQIWSLAGTRMTLDGSGNLYFTLGVGGTATFSGTNKLRYEVDGAY